MYCCPLKTFEVLRCFAPAFQKPKRFYQEAAGPGGRIKNSLAQLWIDRGDNELDNGSRSIELTRITSCVAQFSEHGLIEESQRVDFFRRSELDGVDSVQDVS